MIIYQNSASGFRDEVDTNKIVFQIEKQFLSKFGRKVGQSERNSWNNSLKFMETVIRKSKIADDCGIMIEYNIPSTSKRVDFIVTGQDAQMNENFVIVELKQWDKSEATDKDGIVRSYTGGGLREVTHPSYQAMSYQKYITDMNEAVYSGNIDAHSCAYLHNYQRRDPEPLLYAQYAELVEETPCFFQTDVIEFQEFIKKYVGLGKGMEILYQIENGKIKPSRMLIDYVGEMFKGTDVYTLIDEQKIAYENIVSYALNTTGKSTIIINGGPGTGKSVVSMNAFIKLLQSEKNIKFVAPNASFRTAIVESLALFKSNSRQRLGSLFSGSGNFLDAKDNQFDVLIVDEAHRLKGKGAYMYQGENQIEDIVKAAKVSVFFIDDDQRIRPEDIGSIAEIKRIAKNNNSEVKEVVLEAQFRCSGAEGYLNWVDHTFQIKETANFDGWDIGSFDFKLMDSPNEVLAVIKAKTALGFKARMLAGFAWKWASEKEGNYNGEIEDVSIPEHNFKMPWNGRKISTKWSLIPEGINQIGCVHTSQGLEFDYVGVIIGNDLKYDPKTGKLVASYDDYFDSTGKKGLKDNNEALTTLVKNIYKVLLSRGMKGCYIYCRDDELKKYILGRLSLKDQIVELL